MLALEQMSQLGNVITGVAALLALGLVFYQVQWSRQIQERATTYQIYSEFLKVTLSQPDVSTLVLSADDVTKRSVDGDEDLFGLYEVYFDLMIVAFERLLNINPRDLGTRAYIRSYLEHHSEYLCSARFDGFKGQLDKELRLYIEQLCKEWRVPLAAEGKPA